jgi:hypothetical protein
MKKRNVRKQRSRAQKSDVARSRSTLAVATLSGRSQEARNRALHALTAIRHGASLAEAAKAEGVSQRTIRKYVGSALRQDHLGGRIRALPSDRFTRHLQIPGPDGPIQVTVKGSKEASELAAYVSARAAFLRSGDESALRRFEGKKIGGHTLVTDTKVLTEQAEQGESFDQLYSSLVG